MRGRLHVPLPLDSVMVPAPYPHPREVGGAWKAQGPTVLFAFQDHPHNCTGIEQRSRDICALVAKCVCFARKCHIETAFGIPHSVFAGLY
uniref:HDC14635 n=1 Tax=Drosophila melanogaster TaxID=7227 RepID=Q6IJL6_DROME|nr:TPA_inf: HDC14635 [Drosophila melanogaster]